MALFTLVNLLCDRAFQQPDSIAYAFLEDGKNESNSLTYAQLDQKAIAIATYLQSRLAFGARVLLVYPQGLEAIAAFFGCLYAGVVAIPAPAPEAARLKRVLPRLEAIAVDAGASLILTTANLLAHHDGSNLTFGAKSYVSYINGGASLLLDYYLAEEKIVREAPILLRCLGSPPRILPIASLIMGIITGNCQKLVETPWLICNIPLAPLPPPRE